MTGKTDEWTQTNNALDRLIAHPMVRASTSHTAGVKHYLHSDDGDAKIVKAIKAGNTHKAIADTLHAHLKSDDGKPSAATIRRLLGDYLRDKHPDLSRRKPRKKTTQRVAIATSAKPKKETKQEQHIEQPPKNAPRSAAREEVL